MRLQVANGLAYFFLCGAMPFVSFVSRKTRDRPVYWSQQCSLNGSCVTGELVASIFLFFSF